MKTRVVLIRHAKPADPSSFPTDAERPLVEEGRRVQEEMAQVLKREGIVPDRLLTSPYLRAKQTAQILADVLGGTVVDEPGLAPPFDAQAVLAHLKKGVTNCLIGHDPSLADFANMLLGERYLAGGMVKSGALVIEFEGSIAFGLGSLLNYCMPK